MDYILPIFIYLFVASISFIEAQALDQSSTSTTANIRFSSSSSTTWISTYSAFVSSTTSTTANVESSSFFPTSLTSAIPNVGFSSPSSTTSTSTTNNIESSTSPSTTSTSTTANIESSTSSSTTLTSTLLPSSSSLLSVTTSVLLSTTLGNLVVSVGNRSKILQLPENSVTLSAYVIPKATTGVKYSYKWEMTTRPDGEAIGQITDESTATVKLTELVEGMYGLKVTVNAYGVTDDVLLAVGKEIVNVTVKAPQKVDEPPIAVIKPRNQTITLPKVPIFDGSDSTDDGKILRYKWTVANGPIADLQLQPDDQEMLRLQNLSPGSYTLRLVVTDSNYQTNSTEAWLTVLKEKDYPPSAVAGSDLVFSLPQDSIRIYGNKSSDDKGIVSYEWAASKKNPPTDLDGVQTPFLTLKHPSAGDYSFTLTVKDAADQESSSSVTVYVKPEPNHPPNATAITPLDVILPQASTTLDGSRSTDDKAITGYKWIQLKGPNVALIGKPTEAITAVSSLIRGDYSFQLQVADIEGEVDYVTVDVHVKENVNAPPVANAGGDRMLVLPHCSIVLNGENSHDDSGLLKYDWQKSLASPAAGRILFDSSSKASLYLTDLGLGAYSFNLTVTDRFGASSSDTVKVVVRQDPLRLQVVEMVFAGKLSHLTKSELIDIYGQLRMTLKQTLPGSPILVVRSIADVANGISIKFHVGGGPSNASSLSRGRNRDISWSGPDVVHALRPKLSLLNFNILLLRTDVCQNNCSGRGSCDQTSRSCICSAFWMRNVFSSNYGEDNCDWSILYVVIVVFVLLLAISGFIWLCVRRCCRRRRKTVVKSRHRYRPISLESESDENIITNIKENVAIKQWNLTSELSDQNFFSDDIYVKPPPTGKKGKT